MFCFSAVAHFCKVIEVPYKEKKAARLKVQKAESCSGMKLRFRFAYSKR